MSAIRYFDAHNHLQDGRLDPSRDGVTSEISRIPVTEMVVNGTHEGDWPRVAELARRFPWVRPSFGVHPWYLERVTAEWKVTLERYLTEFPSAVGEIGIDRWMKEPDVALQERIFLEQLELARVRTLPVSIHCIKAWGRLLELLTTAQIPQRGFLLHSYGGSVELIKPFADLGAYFSCSGYFLADRKRAQLETFKHVPADRLLLETDAPDQLLPDSADRYALKSVEGRRLNHPANIVSIYESVAAALEIGIEQLAHQLELNFRALFGSR